MIEHYDPEPEPEPYPERTPETRGRLGPPRRRPPTAVGVDMLPPEPAEPEVYPPTPTLLARFARGSLGVGCVVGGVALALPVGIGSILGSAVLVPAGVAMLCHALTGHGVREEIAGRLSRVRRASRRPHARVWRPAA